jgi:hypothetical protein
MRSHLRYAFFLALGFVWMTGLEAKDDVDTELAAPKTSAQVATYDRMYGVTVDDLSNLPEIVDSLQKLPVRPWVRIVFHIEDDHTRYRRAVAEISKVSAGIVGQPADSTYVARLSLKAYSRRFRKFVDAFPEIDLWEIGNEINGDWLGAAVSSKIDAAFDIVKNAGRRSVLVPYWNRRTCADRNGYWLTWIDQNVSAKVKSGADYVLVSVYGMDCSGSEPSPSDVGRFYARLGQLFPHAALGIGEIGGSERASRRQRAVVLRYYLHLPKLHERDVFFGGYWFFRQDMVPAGTELWKVLAKGMQPS